MRPTRTELRAILGIVLGVVIFLFSWAATNLDWYGQWVRNP